MRLWRPIPLYVFTEPACCRRRPSALSSSCGSGWRRV